MAPCTTLNNMPKMKKEDKLQPQEVEKMLDVLSQLWPGQEEYMRQMMEFKLKEHYGEAWEDKEHCLNCDALMRIYTYKINATACRTLIKLADHVKGEMDKGKSFTEANKIYISGLHGKLTATQTDQKTILRYHGLIAKVKVAGQHKDSLWAITTWGWAFLRGEARSATVSVWRKEIKERSEQLITINDIIGQDGTIPDTRHYDFAPHEGNLI